jgi:hypothetical protein
MRPSPSWSLSCSLLVLFAPACGGDDGGSGVTAVQTTTQATSNATTDPTTSGSSTTGSTGPVSTGDSGDSTMPLTSSATSSGSSGPDTGSTTDDPNCPPVKGEYNDCTDEMGKVDNTLCKWMGTGENGYISCVNDNNMDGASTCTLLNCMMDCHCFNQPATGTAKSVCKPMFTDKGDNACALDCSNGATCPDGMVCDNDTCWWPAP